MDKTPYVNMVASTISNTFVQIKFMNRMRSTHIFDYTNINYKNIKLNVSHTKQDIVDIIKNLELIELRELLCIFITDIVQIIPEDFPGSTSMILIEKIKLTMNIITGTIKLYANNELNDSYKQLKINYESQRVELETLRLKYDQLEDKFDTINKILS